MSLSITQQKIKGGHEVLMVRDGSIRLLTFPLDMRALANEMCLEGNDLEEEEYPALVKKYQGKRLEQARKPAPAPVQRLRDVIAPISMGDSAALRSALAAEKARVDELAKNPLPKTTPVETPKPPEGVEVDEWLGALLAMARKAETQLGWAVTHLQGAERSANEAKIRSEAAWKEFNLALRASLPGSTHVKGVAIGSDNFFEQLIKTAQQMGGEVS